MLFWGQGSKGDASSPLLMFPSTWIRWTVLVSRGRWGRPTVKFQGGTWAWGAKHLLFPFLCELQGVPFCHQFYGAGSGVYWLRLAGLGSPFRQAPALAFPMAVTVTPLTVWSLPAWMLCLSTGSGRENRSVVYQPLKPQYVLLTHVHLIPWEEMLSA